MSKGKDSKHNNPPNVVAKLMGLETLPKGEPNSSVVRSHRKYYYSSQHVYGHLGSPFKHWQQLDERFMDKEMLHQVHPSTEHLACKDGYEIWLQSHRASNVRDKLPERGKWGSEEDVDVGKMALIRQKFMEAKRMSTDERLHRSKQYEDALEVLSSNSDLLIRFLDSQKLYDELPSTTPPDDHETKHITLIKPLKMVHNDKPAAKGKKNDRLIKKPVNADPATVWENRNLGYSPQSQKVDEFPVQSTQIVVLKPSPGRTHDLNKALVSPRTSSPRSFYQGTEGDNVPESIKVAKEITMQMHEGLRTYQKDHKTSYPSIFSNGYSGDEGSFNKSYHEYTPGKFSDSEAASPLRRNSWDYYTIGCESPYSTLSLGRASCSPESSVCIEAKKRLSERWTMVTSNDKGHQEQRRVRRNSTLGEMLSLSVVKKSVTSEVESINKEQEPSKSVSCSHSFNEEMSTDGSVSASSIVYETGAHGSKVQAKSKSTRSSSFKGKVASFLFSRNKKSTKKKSSASQSKDELQTSVTETSVLPPGVLRDDGGSQSFNIGGFEECSLAALCESSGKTSTDSVSNSNGQQQDMITLEPGLPVSKPMVPEISRENQDQPSPISVLETPFEYYNNNTAHESLDCMKGDHMGSGVPLNACLIDKSPPIESVARTLSWDDSCAEVSTSTYPVKPSSLDTNVEEQEWLLLVHKLVSAAGLDDDDYQEQQYDSFHTRWHSLESPLDPSLRDTYANLNDKDPLDHPLLLLLPNEAKRRKIRSNQKLVFDCVNAALLEVVGYYGSESYSNSSSMYSEGHIRKGPLVQEGASSPPLLVDHIVAQMKELIASGVRCGGGEGYCGDRHSMVVENVVRKEAVQIGWVELMRLEIDVLGREIERELIEELVENAVVDFIGRA